MASNREERGILSDMFSLHGAGTLAGTGALAVGGYLGWKNIKSNENITNPLTGPGRLSRTSSSVGKQLKSRLDRMSQDVARELLDSDKLKELVSTTQSQKAVLAALASSLDDPEVTGAIHETQIQDFKKQLATVMESIFQTEKEFTSEQSDLIQSIVKSIYTQGEKNVLGDFAGRVRDFQGISSFLAAPTQEAMSGQPFTRVEHGHVRGRASKRLQGYAGLFKGTFDMETVQIEAPGAKGKQTYMRLFERKNGRRRWVNTVPLDLAGSGVVYTGENLQTAYMSDRFYANASEAMDYLQNNKGASVAEMMRGDYGRAPVVQGPEEHLFGLIKKHGFKNGQYDPRAGRDLLTKGMLGDVLPRTMFFEDSPLAAHQLRQMEIRRSTVAFTGAQAVDSRAFIRAFATVPGFDSGVGSERFYSEPMDNFAVARMGLRKKRGVAAGLGIDQFNVYGTGEAGRLSRANELPITAREMQVLGRNAMFRPTGIGANEWKNVEGLTNQLMVLDFNRSGRLMQQLKGTGQVYSSGRFAFTNAATMTILDPKQMAGSSTALLEKIIASSNKGEWFSASAQELRETYGGILGFTDEGQRMINLPMDASGMRFRVHTTSTYRGKHELHLATEIERASDNVKLFGIGHKGLVLPKSFQELLGIVANTSSGSADVTPGFLTRLGAREGNLLVGAADTAMKAPAYLAALMANSVAVMGGRDVTQYVSQTKWADDQNLLSRYATASINRLVEARGPRDRKPMLENIGRTLAGLWAMAEEDGNGVIVGDMKSFGAGDRVTREQLTGMLRAHGIHGAELDTVKEYMNTGRMVTSSGFALGTGPGDLNFGRGSFEPRSAQYLMNRLKSSGMADDDIATVMGDVIGRKLGFAPSMRGAVELARMSEGVVGPQSLAGAIDQQDVPRLTLSELEKMGGYSAVSKQAQYKSGFFLELGQESGARGTQIKAAAEAAFNGGTALRIPGQQGMANFRGTKVKTSGKAIAVGSEVESMVTNLFDDLSRSMSNRTEDVTETLTGKLSMYRERVTGLFADVFYNLAGGKVRGLRSGHGSQINLSGTSNMMSGELLDRYRSIYKSTGGTSIYSSASQFMGQVHDFMGRNTSDGADKLERFFMSPYASVDDIMKGGSNAKLGGVYGFGMRHPQVGSGNIALMQLFRWHGDDYDPFQEIMKSDWGRKALGGSKIGSFEELYKRGDKGMISDVFAGMAKNLSSFMGTHAAADQYHIPVWKIEAAGRKMDIGFAGGSIGDFDADIYMFSPFSRKSSGLVGKKALGRAHANFDFAYKFSLTTFADAAKAGLEDLATISGNLDLDEIIRQNALKEHAVKASTGSLDVQLNQLRGALLQNVDSSPQLALQADAMLAALQEHTTIKGKKLPLYRDFAGMFGAAVDQMFEGNSASVRALFETTIFRNTAAHKDLWTGRKVSVQELMKSGIPEQLLGGMDDVEFNLGRIVDFMQESADKARMGGNTAFDMSAGRIRAALSSRNSGAHDALREYLYLQQSMQGSMMSELLGQSIDRAATMAEGQVGKVLHAGDIMDRRLLGPLAIGAVAMAGITSLASGGYSNEPLMAPGEMSDPRVDRAVAGNHLFNRPDPMVDSPPPSGDFAQVQGPVNSGTTYARRPSSYNIHGDVRSMYGIRQMREYMGGISGYGGSGQIRINDDRRPITQNYMDRMMGEY